VKASEAVDAALQKVERTDDGGADIKAIIDLIVEEIEFDETKARRQKAVQAFKARCKPGSTEPEGQLILPGLEPYGYEPQRLIADNEGHVIEQARAKPYYKNAEAARARDNARKATVWADRKTNESAGYSDWTIEQLGTGRPIDEITFDVFVRETGIWSPGVAATEPSPDDNTFPSAAAA